ncbi:MAG: TerB family tellurite resistance protein [Ignavibacteriales bacterium]|nr:MAG: TerB family tellurite resistance protein [Ignavibacteriales bacterium]
MIKYLKELFSSSGENLPEEKYNINSVKKLQVATCALLVEMANADDEFTDEEKEKIIHVMHKTFNLDKEYVDDLIELSEEKIRKSISIYEFSTIINENFTKDEKFELMKNLWRLIYVDDTLNMHEDHLIKKIGKTLNMEHQDVIAAKLIVKEEKK